MEESYYKELVNRNIGLVTKEQQEKLKNSCVAIFGLGGIGGVVAELLARCGIGYLKIVDNDRFEPTNLNRQIFSFQSTIAKMKIDVVESFLKDINPFLRIEKFDHVDKTNINQILGHCDVAVLAIDKVKPIIIISRKVHELGIPMVEGWAIPFGNVRIYTKDTKGLEETYGLLSLGRELEDISNEEFAKMDFEILMTLGKIEGIANFYPPHVVQEISRGRITSFAPMVWLTSVLMSLEVIKILLDWGTISLAPRYALYDPFSHKIPRQEL